MKAYLWDETERVTGNWHDDGAVLIVAVDLDDARARWRNHARAERTKVYDERPSDTALDEEPTASWSIDGLAEPVVYVFPNSGCC